MRVFGEAWEKECLGFIITEWYHFFLQYLFDTTKDITVLHCGHTIHLECLKEMERHFQ